MKRRRANDDKRPKWVWKDLEWGSPPWDPITPIVFNLLVTFKWWRNKDRHKRERYRKWLDSAHRRLQILPRDRQDR